MESGGFQPNLAQGMTELAEVIAGPENYVEAVGVVKGREVSFFLVFVFVFVFVFETMSP